MRVQTKLILGIIPAMLAGFIALGFSSTYSSKSVMRSNAFLYIDTVLDARFNHTLQRRSDLLRASKMDKVTSFLSMFQKEALDDLQIGSDSKYGCFLVFNPQGDRLFASRDFPAESTLSQFRSSALLARTDPTHQQRGLISNGAQQVFCARYFEPWDWVVVYSVETSGFEKAINKTLILAFGLAGLCIVACALVIVLIFRRVIGVPILRLKDAAARIANREPNVGIDVTSKDEMGDLSFSLKEMATSIFDHVNQLQQLQNDLKQSNEAMKLEIIEKRKAQIELKSTHDKLATTFNAIPDLLFEVDAEGRIHDFHAPDPDDLYSVPEIFLGRTVREVLPADAANVIMETICKVAQQGRQRGTIYHLDLPSGKRYFELSIAAKGEVGDRGAHFVAIAHDITERRLAEEARANLESQLNQSQKMESVGRLAGGVAHDFNNMLMVILAHTEIALMRPDLPSALRESLEEVFKAGKRSAELTRQLLAFARKQTIAPKVLDLNATVTGMLKMLQRLMGEEIDLVWSQANPLWPVRMDPSQIDQILANLCVNARDAISTSGKITIETGNAVFDEAHCSAHAGYSPGEFVRLAISDNGHGMDKETLSHIFEPFFTTKSAHQGTGLGLATVYGIVKQNNGFITVYSELGHGTTFMIYLPRHLGASEQPQSDEAVGIARPRGETILLVEDEPATLKSTKMMIEALGFMVQATDDPDEALRLIQEPSAIFHLLLTDVIMPKMNGLDLSIKLKTLCPDLKCLFMSGYTSTAIGHHGVLDEGMHFIQKPFSMNDLMAKVCEVLKSRDGIRP